MTTINTFEDILEAMERNPDLRDAMRRIVQGQAELASIARRKGKPNCTPV